MTGGDQVPTTRGWFTGTVGGPFGDCWALRQRPLLVWSRAGVPLTSTRVAGVSHWMRTHGIGVLGGTVNGQPAIMN